MVLSFTSSFWFSITTCLCHLLGFITRFLFSFNEKNNLSNSNTHEEKQIASDQFKQEPEPEPEVIDFGVTEYDGFGEKETPRFSFKFQCQPNQEEEQLEPSTITNNTNKCQFLPGKDFSGFMDEPEVVSFTVKELFADWSEDSLLDNKQILESGFLEEKDFKKVNSEQQLIIHEEEANSNHSNELEESVDLTHEEEEVHHILEEEEDKEEGEEELSGFDSDPELIHYGDRFSVLVEKMDSNSDDFLSEKDFDGELEPEIVTNSDKSIEEIPNSEKIITNSGLLVPEDEVESSTSVQNSKPVLDHEPLDFDKEAKLVDEIGRNFEEANEKNSSSNSETEVVSTSEDIYTQVKSKEDNNGGKVAESMATKQKHVEPEVVTASENFYTQVKSKEDDNGGNVAESMATKQNHEEPVEPNPQNSSSDDSEDSSRLEVLWEHQDLIEQLKMELRKVRATGLPTILEESESPRMSDDLKPWNFDEKFLHEDRMDELHKFYKSYRERMRKFDILNYQKMYAIGFLQHKDPLQSISVTKSSAPTLGSILSQHLRLLPKRRKPEADSVKFIKELQSALEMVYVGQMCLSWEFLHWQYGKAKDLLESDLYETRQYNQVAGEFQQFQVLMQRFLENEPFQGPRVQHYIKSRCVLRNLLQVPVIKEDPKDKLGVRRRKDAITCSMLSEIIEESIRIFWDFLRADKDESNMIFKGLLSPNAELQDPADSRLLLEVQTILQKKEKKLKDILRSGNCIVKRFQKCQEERSDQLVFFSQIDLKLVSRVLNMSRLTTEQLVWCHKKLNKISFVHRKIHVEPSFLLFPC